MKKRIHHPHPVLRVIRLVVGILLVILGTVSFLIPILPNWLFIIPGLGLLAPESRHIRKLVVWLRARLRLRRFRKAQRLAAAQARQAAANSAPGAAHPAAAGGSGRGAAEASGMGATDPRASGAGGGGASPDRSRTGPQAPAADTGDPPRQASGETRRR